MRYAILADIHANLAAFTAVLEDIERRGGADELWCLGDVVGYGPEPRECIELLRRYRHRCVAGNHDRAAAGKIDIASFNENAAAACTWTAGQLEPADIEYLERLPLLDRTGDFTLVHGSPREPVLEYLVSTAAAEGNLPFLRTRFCLVGHSHIPLVFEFNEDGVCEGRELMEDEMVTLGENRLILNPGSIGQPRNGDPRSAYALYDTASGTIEARRIPYDIRATQARMAVCGLPERLRSRLDLGL